MNRRGFFAALLVAPFAAATLLSNGAGKYWPGMNITRQAFQEALEAHERTMEATGMTMKELERRFRETVRVSTKRVIIERNKIVGGTDRGISLYDPT
jgi:hypothetical protein